MNVNVNTCSCIKNTGVYENRNYVFSLKKTVLVFNVIFVGNNNANPFELKRIFKNVLGINPYLKLLPLKENQNIIGQDLY